MTSAQYYLNFLRKLASTLMRGNRYFSLAYVFMYYFFIRLEKLMNQCFEWQTLPDDVMKKIITKLCTQYNQYVDSDCCLLANVKYFKSAGPVWVLICSKESMRKYKILLLPFNDGKENTIFISDTVKYNLENTLHCSEFNESCFLLPIKKDVVTFAQEAKVSLISNPHESINNLAEDLLKSYFSVPRFLRANDLFCINVKEHLPEQIYAHSIPFIPWIYFKVNSMKIANNASCAGSYIVHGETTLLQETNVHSYLPPKSSCLIQDDSLLSLSGETKEHLVQKCPPSLVESLQYLEECISPFIKKNIQLPIKPIFLVKGGQGSGKRKLIRNVSEKMGLHLLCTDFAEVQTLTSAQTEAKLRIVLNHAKQCTPCILCLNNIEVFGKNSEGQKDERIISAFAAEVNSLYNQNSKCPLIIIATCDETDLPAELNRIFIETIKIDHLNQAQRESLMSWLLRQGNLNHELNLSKIVGICSDFRFHDFTALMLHAVKARYKHITHDSEEINLRQEDFDKAYEYMQSIYTDCKGAPRVPKVHWEDIGGLADLKHEIMRRIQLPLLNAFGFGQSGLLLYGPPGTGKTLLAKAVATEYQLHFLSIKGPEVLNMYVGQSEKNVRQVFERARSAAPCIIFFDELDSLAPNRGRSGDSGGVMDRVVSQLLAEMDGLESSSSIFIIGATNRPDLIDPALLRPGRFDKMLYVGIHSDQDSQLSVLKALTRKFKLRENGEELIKLLSHLPNHTTGADLYSICSDAWLSAARNVLNKYIDEEDDTNSQTTAKEDKLNSSISVELEDFVKAARELVPSVTEEEARRYEKMQRELSSVS